MGKFNAPREELTQTVILYHVSSYLKMIFMSLSHKNNVFHIIVVNVVLLEKGKEVIKHYPTEKIDHNQ